MAAAACLLSEFVAGKNFKSAKVFSSLSWRWSLRSPPSGGPDCPPGAAPSARQPGRHSTTLDRLLADEQKLYKEVKVWTLPIIPHGQIFGRND